VIHLNLLHPIKNVPVQSWSFEDESVIRIGRGTDNHVVLYSAVVSRRHVELRHEGSGWLLISLGTNGTYVDGKRITQLKVADGATIRLARSGPNIQIRIGDEVTSGLIPDAGERTVPQAIRLSSRSQITLVNTDVSDRNPSGIVPVPPHLIATTPKTSQPQDPEYVPRAGSESGRNQTTPPSSNLETPQGKINHISHMETGAPPELGTAPPPEPTRQPNGAIDKFAASRFDPVTGQPLKVIKTVNGYQIIDIVGESRVATTYLAWQDGRALALKTVNDDWLGDSQAAILFEHEAEVLRQVAHPNLPKFFDFFLEDGQPYLAMEMIYGEDMAKYVTRRGAILQPEAIVLMLEVCSLLEYLHRFSPPILHRELRPNNIILRTTPYQNRRIAVMDVGAARVVGLEAETHIGLACYSAPEQQEGHAVPASDLYSLGPLLVYLLTGQNPGRFYQFKDDEFYLNTAIIPNLSLGMKAIVDRLSQPDPQARFKSAREVGVALRQLLKPS